MLKKILLGALMIGVVGVLIAGAVIRTRAVAGDGAAGEAGRRGGAAASVVTGADGGGRGGQGQGGGWNSASTAVDPLADVAPEAWLTVKGTVVSATSDLVEIKTESDEVITFEGRPLSFALEQRFSLKVGDAVTVAGFDENGEFKLGKVTNLNSGKSITLRDASGRPAWSGRGRNG